jgi:hypothetical protein
MRVGDLVVIKRGTRLDCVSSRGSMVPGRLVHEVPAFIDLIDGANCGVHYLDASGIRRDAWVKTERLEKPRRG